MEVKLSEVRCFKSNRFNPISFCCNLLRDLQSVVWDKDGDFGDLTEVKLNWEHISLAVCGILIRFKVTSVYVTASWLGAGIGCNDMKTWRQKLDYNITRLRARVTKSIWWRGTFRLEVCKPRS